MSLTASSNPAVCVMMLAQRDRLAVVVGNLEVEIRVDVRVEIQLALLDQLHRRRPGDQLADRTGPEQRAVRIDGRALLDDRRSQNRAR